MQAIWRRIRADYVPRSSHEISFCNGRIFSWGGEHIPRHAIESPERFVALTPSQDSWEIIASSGPSPRFGHGQAVIGDSIFVFGGRQGLLMNEVAMNDLHRYNTSTGEWTEIHPAATSPSPPPCVRSFHRMVSLNKTLFVFGGCGAEGRLSDLYSFNTETSHWQQLPSSPKICGRGGACFFGLGNKLYVVAGFSGEENKDMHEFCLETNTWREIDLPGLRARSVCGHTALPSLGKLLIFGGEIDPSEKGHAGAGMFLNDVVIITPPQADEVAAKCEIATVVEGGEIPCQRGWTAATYVDGEDGKSARVVLSGGLAGDDENPTRLGDSFEVVVSHA